MSLLKHAIKWVMGIFSKKNSPSLPQEGIHYEFKELTQGTEEVTGVKVLDGPYVDVIYYYGRVKVIPEGDKHILSFDYAIYDAPISLDINADLKSQDFKRVIGDILVSILLSEKGEYATVRNIDSEESDLQ